MKRYLLGLYMVVAASCGPKSDEQAKASKAEDKVELEASQEADKAKGDETEKEAGEGADDRLKGPVAKVNGVDISSDDFYAELDKITERGAKIPEDRMDRIKQNIVKRLIDKELIAQAVKAEEVEVPEADIEEGLKAYKERFQSEEQYENFLKHGRVSQDSIEERIRDRRALEILLEKKGSMDVSDEEALEFYQKNERFYTEKAGIKAAHILVKLPQNASDEQVAEAEKKIKEADARLKAGEDFGEVAKAYGDGPAADKGGDLGFFSKGRMVKEFEEVAFAMKPGEVSAPVRSRLGFHIIKLEERRDDRKKSFDEVSEQIKKSLHNKKFFTERRKLLAEFEKNAKIERLLDFSTTEDRLVKTRLDEGAEEEKAEEEKAVEEGPSDNAPSEEAGE